MTPNRLRPKERSSTLWFWVLLAPVAAVGACRSQPIKPQDERPDKSKPAPMRRPFDPDRPGTSNAERSISQALRIKRGEAALAQRKPHEALNLLRQALATLPGSPRSAEIHFLMGQAYEMTEQRQQAIAAFEKGVSIEPSNPSGHYLLALAYKGAKRLALAHKSIRRAVSLAPRNLVYRFDLVTIELVLGQKIQGERHYRDYEKLRNDYIAQLKSDKVRLRLAAVRSLGTVPSDVLNIKALTSALPDASAPVRAAVARSLARSATKEPSARKALSAQLALEKDADARKAIRTALAKLPLP